MDKTFVFNPDGGNSGMMNMLSGLMGKNTLDPNLVAALMNGRNNQDQFGAGGGGGMWFMWIILLFFMGRRGFGGDGGESLPTALANDSGRELILQAIQGNANAIGQLSTQLNCDVTSLQNGINGINNTLATLSGTIGMNTQQIINSLQMGNATLANQLAQCCCDLQNSITTQGFEGRIQTIEQTNQLNYNATQNKEAIISRLDAMEKSNLLDKIDAYREKNAVLQGEISQRNQNAYFAQIIAPIQADIAALKCNQPPTYPMQYMPGQPLVNYATPFCGGGFYGGGGAPFYGGGYNNGGCCNDGCCGNKTW